MWKRLWKEEQGQTLVMFALLLSVLMGFAALVVDVGYLYAEKRQLQTAVDAAALAGAQDLPFKIPAEQKAEEYAESNIKSATTVATTPYKLNSKLLEVASTKNVPTFFGKVFGVDSVEIKADAVAQKVDKWAGEALPFINLDDDYKDNPIVGLWEKIEGGNGDFERLWKEDFDTIKIYVNEDGKKNNGNLKDVEYVYFDVKYENGIDVTKGVVADIKQELAMAAKPNEMTYIFSLRSDLIGEEPYNGLEKSLINNKATIPLEHLVLLQVKIIDYKFNNQNDAKLQMEYVKEFDIFNGEYPTEFIRNDERGTSKLVH